MNLSEIADKMEDTDASELASLMGIGFTHEEYAVHVRDAIVAALRQTYRLEMASKWWD